MTLDSNTSQSSGGLRDTGAELKAVVSIAVMD